MFFQLLDLYTAGKLRAVFFEQEHGNKRLTGNFLTLMWVSHADNSLSSQKPESTDSGVFLSHKHS